MLTADALTEYEITEKQSSRITERVDYENGNLSG